MSRFDRQLLIPDWSQERLSAAVVVIVGIGALGNEVSRILAQTGVGTLVLCDPDRVDESNLSRAVLFRQRDVGNWKVDAAAQSLSDLLPGVKLDIRRAALVNGLGLAELRDASLIVSCLDSRTARLQLAGRCQLVRASLLDGGTHPWGGEVRPYFDPTGPCYGCGLGETLRGEVDSPWNCVAAGTQGPVPSAAPSSALVGTWMAMVATRYLMRLDCPAGTLKIDGVRGTTSIVRQERDPSCPLHQPLGEVTLARVSHRDRVRDLAAELADHEVALAWEPVQRSVKCPRCRHEAATWGRPAASPCPQCETLMVPSTTLELSDAPGDLPLTDLGIATREILTVRSPQGLRWLELESAEETHTSSTDCRSVEIRG
jgi:molybdopterin/thiamine biosynthesis adenylyltransferase